MTKYREILRIYSQGISQRNIALSCSCSRNTVANVIRKSKACGISWPLAEEVTDGELHRQFFPKKAVSERKMPDLAYLHKELRKQGVTLSLLWHEYCETCRLAGELPLMYSQFCYHYQQYAQKHRATMHIPRKPAEICEIDWAGKTLSIIDRATGELLPAYIFVSALSYSQYAYAEAFFDQKVESWIDAHVHMFEYSQGVTKMLVPDNLKTGVSAPDWYTPVINRTYHELAEHYNTAVVPARSKRPKDKPNAEGAVGFISTWIIAALRHREFFSLRNLNRAIREKLQELNRRPFQKKTGSRLSIFLEAEKSMLLPLPDSPFELATWKQATVQFNYHISVEKNHYSAPYEYIKQRVDVRITRQMIEVFYNHTRICSHPRIHGKIGQYSTVASHMPADHQAYIAWDAQRFKSWAQKIGPNTVVTVTYILSSFKVEQQAFRSCMGLLKLADKYSVARLETACSIALSYTPRPSLKSVKNILATGQDTLPRDDSTPDSTRSASHGFTHGAAYYGRKNR